MISWFDTISRNFPKLHTCKCQVPSDRGRGGRGWPAPALRQKGVHRQEAAGGWGPWQPWQEREWGSRRHRGQSAEQPPGLPRPGPDLRPPASRGKQKFREQYQQLFPAARDHARWEPGGNENGFCNVQRDQTKVYNFWLAIITRPKMVNLWLATNRSKGLKKLKCWRQAITHVVRRTLNLPWIRTFLSKYSISWPLLELIELPYGKTMKCSG